MNGALQNFLPLFSLRSLFDFNEATCVGIADGGKRIRMHIAHIHLLDTRFGI